MSMPFLECDECDKREVALKELLKATKNFMKRLDDGTLLRDISRDMESDFHFRMLEFVAELNQAKTAIEKAERDL